MKKQKPSAVASAVRRLTAKFCRPLKFKHPIRQIKSAKAS